MKPLELTVYPKMGSVYYDDEANCTWSESMAYGLSVEKRFTDAELAAEYWAAHGEANALMTGNQKLFFSKRQTIKRFASRPHYDEADQ